MLVPFLLAAGLSINHQPADCFVKDRFARLELSAEPAMGVSAVRVFFKSARDDEFHFVRMSYAMGRFVAKLPRPREKAGTLTYYIEVIGGDGSNRKTPEITAQVVKTAEACPAGGRVAEPAEDGDVKVWALGAARGKPREFAGIDKVLSERDA